MSDLSYVVTDFVVYMTVLLRYRTTCDRAVAGLGCRHLPHAAYLSHWGSYKMQPFSHDILKWHFVKENLPMLIQISVTFVPISHYLEQRWTSLLKHVCVTLSQYCIATLFFIFFIFFMIQFLFWIYCYFLCLNQCFIPIRQIRHCRKSSTSCMILSSPWITFHGSSSFRSCFPTDRLYPPLYLYPLVGTIAFSSRHLWRTDYAHHGQWYLLVILNAHNAQIAHTLSFRFFWNLMHLYPGSPFTNMVELKSQHG